MVKAAVHKGEGHRERLRYKFMGSGLSGFHDYEVIELLLTLATPRKDCKEAAKAALSKFKTLQGVLDASAVDLCEVKGIGPMNLFGLRLVKAVANRYLQKKVIHKEPLGNSKALFDYLYLNMSTKDRECFKALFLDAKNRVVAVEDLFCGTLTASSVYPREVVRAALGHKAAAVIFAHNHPSGDPSPSPADFSITRQLIFACRTMGIVVHEHIVIGENRYYSFADQGVIAEINQEFKCAESAISYDKRHPTP
jgi:DNA repair protein RadC